MAGIRVSGYKGSGEEMIGTGDAIIYPDYVLTLNTGINAGLSISAAQMVTGVINRTGPTSAVNDSFDNPANLIAALAGNNNGPVIQQGMSIKLRYINSTTTTLTSGWTLTGTGWLSGIGVGANSVAVPTLTYRDFLITFNSVQPVVSNIANLVGGSPNVTWSLAAGQTSESQGPSPLAINITAGCSVTGTGVPNGTTVLDVVAGQGGTLGVIMSANATATGTNVTLTFGPQATINSIGSGPA